MKHLNSIRFLLLLSVAATVNNAQDIIDFQYSKYVVDPNSENKWDHVELKPEANQTNYNFPDVCYLAKKFETSITEGAMDPDSEEMNENINNLKHKFVELLKIGEKLKAKKHNLEEISTLRQGNLNASMVMSESERELLKKFETELTEMNQTINEKTQQLERLLYENFNNQKRSPLNEVALDFKIQSLNEKIKYLRGIVNSQDKESSTQNKPDIQKFFKEMEARFDEENSLVEGLNEVLKAQNLIKIFKQKLAVLSNKIQISNLMIDEKESCFKQIQEIRKNQKNQKQIKSLMQNLREKKKDINNIGNKYCEGVTKKLEQRLKNVLRSYDITFQCADGLQSLRNQKQEDQKMVEQLKKKIQQLQDPEKRSSFQDKFENNRKFIKQRNEEIKRFSIPEYSHNKEPILLLLDKAIKELEQTQQQRKQAESRPTRASPEDFVDIRKLIKQLKVLKGKYCSHHEIYEKKAQQIWSRLRKYEAEIEYKKKVDKFYNQQLNSMRNLEIEFENLRQDILVKIQ